MGGEVARYWGFKRICDKCERKKNPNHSVPAKMLKKIMENYISQLLTTIRKFAKRNNSILNFSFDCSLRVHTLLKGRGTAIQVWSHRVTIL